MKRRAVLLVMFLVGCGSGGGSDNNPAPTTHLLDQSALRDIPTGQAVSVGPLTVPAGATMTYQIVDMPTGVGSDTMDTGIVTDATAQAANPTTFAAETSVSSTEETTPSLAAGTYDLLVTCHNLVDDCTFTDTVTAFY
jgi:hypothetical protein